MRKLASSLNGFHYPCARVAANEDGEACCLRPADFLATVWMCTTAGTSKHLNISAIDADIHLIHLLRSGLQARTSPAKQKAATD